MASGDLTASVPVLVDGGAALKTAIDDLNLTAVTDKIAVVPIQGSGNQYYVFKVEREA